MAVQHPAPFAPPPSRLTKQVLAPWPSSLAALRRAAEQAQASVPDLVRVLVVQHGVPDGSPAELSSASRSGSESESAAAAAAAGGQPAERPEKPETTWRSVAWKLLLLPPAGEEQGLSLMSAQAYADLVRRAASREAQQISNDGFRTLATDSAFRARVSDAQLVRLLNAYVWKQDLRLSPIPNASADAPGNNGNHSSSNNSNNSNTDNNSNNTLSNNINSSSSSSSSSSQPPVYMQGMNVLCAPFLYALPWELEAFACFSALVEKHCPTYVLPTLAGVHQGVQILDLCLAEADAELSAHLASNGLNAQLYAFASVLTLGASQPPLVEVLKLWDFFWARGVHMNLLCVLAQVCSLKTKLLATSRPMDLLRSFPPLEAHAVIAQALALESRLSPALLALIQAHTLQYPLKLPSLSACAH